MKNCYQINLSVKEATFLFKSDSYFTRQIEIKFKSCVSRNFEHAEKLGKTEISVVKLFVLYIENRE